MKKLLVVLFILGSLSLANLSRVVIDGTVPTTVSNTPSVNIDNTPSVNIDNVVTTTPLSTPNAQIYGDIGTNEWRTVQIDDSTHAWKTIEYEHAEIHDGRHFEIVTFNTITDGAAITISFTTTDNARWPHMIYAIDGKYETTMEFYENPTGLSGGAAITPFNQNRNSTNTSNMEVRYGVTVTDPGMIIDCSKFGDDTTPAGKGGQGGGNFWHCRKRCESSVFLV